MAYSLSLYLQDAAALLRDSGNFFTSKAQLTRYVNQGRRQAARRTGCIRLLICGQSQYGASAQPGFLIPGAAIPGNLPDAVQGSGSTNLFQTIPNVESYPFSFGNAFMREQYDGADEITDIVAVSVSWGAGSYRPTLNWCPFEDGQAMLRAWSVLNSAFPMYWFSSQDGNKGVVYLWPPPVEAMEMEWDVIALPKALNTDSDVELLPDGFTTAVPYYAAGLAYLNSRPLQAMIMLDAFADRLGIARFSSDYGKSTSMYLE